MHHGCYQLILYAMSHAQSSSSWRRLIFCLTFPCFVLSLKSASVYNELVTWNQASLCEDKLLSDVCSAVCNSAQWPLHCSAIRHNKALCESCLTNVCPKTDRQTVAWPVSIANIMHHLLQLSHACTSAEVQQRLSELQQHMAEVPRRLSEVPEQLSKAPQHLLNMRHHITLPSLLIAAAVVAALLLTVLLMQKALQQVTGLLLCC